MLKYGNRDFRNLQEQVYANMRNIEDIIKGSNIIADLNVIHIVGTAESAAELPDPDTYTGAYGDAIAVGTEEPYDLYIFSKAYENENAPQWFNIGEFPQPGPEGPQGPKGDTGLGIPEIESGDAGKVLTVNEAESEAVWAEVQGLTPEQEAVLDRMEYVPGQSEGDPKLEIKIPFEDDDPQSNESIVIIDAYGGIHGPAEDGLALSVSDYQYHLENNDEQPELGLWLYQGIATLQNEDVALNVGSCGDGIMIESDSPTVYFGGEDNSIYLDENECFQINGAGG